MAYDELLADRISNVLKEKNAAFYEKRMFGGIAFMVNDKMCVGVIKSDLMARIDPEIHDESIKKEGCRAMDFTKRPMKGYVYIEPGAIDLNEDLDYWINLALDFNPRAKSSKKK